jgi:hypothetical protein
LNAVAQIAEVVCSEDIQTDDVALDIVVVGVRNLDAITDISGDDVAIIGTRTPDPVVG